VDTAQFTILGDKECLWNALDVISLRGARPYVRTVEIGDVEFINVGKRLFFGIHPVDTDENDTLAFILSPGLFEIGGFFAARWTPRSPKVDNDHLASQFA